MSDPVSSPFHYTQGSIECKQAIASMMGEDCYIIPEGCDRPLSPIALHWWAAATEYLWRWPFKNGIQDLEKVKQDIDFLIEEIQKRGTTRC